MGRLFFGGVVLLFSAFTAQAASELKLKFYGFSQELRAKAEARIPRAPDHGLFIVKFRGKILPRYREALAARGVQMFHYVPEHAILALVPSSFARQGLEALGFVEQIIPYSPAFKLEEPVLRQWVTGPRDQHARPYNVVALTTGHKAPLEAKLKDLGAFEISGGGGSILLKASLTLDQLDQVVGWEEVVWVDRASQPELDMDNAHLQGGAVDLQSMIPGGLTGKGIRGHIMEGIYAEHPDFRETELRQAPIALWDPSPASHGSNTFGEVFGSGAGNKKAKGLLPDGQGFYTNYSVLSQPGKSRFDLVEELIEKHGIQFQTASWGDALTLEYTSISADMDHLIFQLDLPITQSQSNSGSQMSRPQAWAKNIISVGALRSGNNSDPKDDAWTGSASIGPAADGRIKPEVAAYYDSIDTTDGASSYRTDFGGTSGATPIVAGFLGLTINLVQDKHIPVVGKLHAMTAKALLVHSARQYPFSGQTHDLTRTHQGWGFPNVADLFSKRKQLLVVNEQKPLQVNQSATYTIQVPTGARDFRATTAFREPEALPASTQQTINNLNLKVVDPKGTVYYGNAGLLFGTESVAGTIPDKINTLENVLIAKPAPGTWKVIVEAAEVNVDAHLATPGVLDSAFALVASYGTPQ